MDIGRAVLAIVVAVVGAWALREEREVVRLARRDKKAQRAYWLGDGDESD